MRTFKSALLALAALALPSAAAAQASDLTFYGSIVEFGDSIRTTGATKTAAAAEATQVADAAVTGVNLPSRMRLTSGTTNLGFRGSLELLPGLKAIFQVETAVNPDGDQPVPSTWATRNSHVGLQGEWGTLTYGLWDTPYKLPLLFVGPIRGLNPFDNAISANPGFSVPATTTQTTRSGRNSDAAFNRRQGNLLQYASPKLYGLSARVAYSFDEGRTMASATAPAIGPRLYSALLSYDWQALGVRYGFERHVDYFGLAQLGGTGPSFTNRHATDDGHELIAFYTLPTGTKLSVIVDRLSYSTDDTADNAVTKYTRMSGYALLQQRVGDHQLWASYGKALEGECEWNSDADCKTDGLAGTQLTAGYSYSLTKSVDLYAAFYRMQNEKSASYAAFPPVAASIAPGADTTGFGVGIFYSFAGTFGKPAAPAAPAAPAPAPAPAAPAAPTPAPAASPT